LRNSDAHTHRCGLSDADHYSHAYTYGGGFGYTYGYSNGNSDAYRDGYGLSYTQLHAWLVCGCSPSNSCRARSWRLFPGQREVLCDGRTLR